MQRALSAGGLWILGLLVSGEPSLGSDNRYLPTSNTGEIIHHSHYVLSYSERHEQAEWVAYELTASETLGGVARTDNFRADPFVAGGSATLGDYRGTGYDRGHLAPAGDMGFSSAAMAESFLLSNVSPQEASFNRGLWKKLEAQVRAWAASAGDLYVVTGPVLSGVRRSIGSNRVTVPRGFFKALLDDNPATPRAIAFMMPNEKSRAPLSTFALEVSALEATVGIDFFPGLPDSLEHALESRLDLTLWAFSEDATKTTESVQCSGVTSRRMRCKNRTRYSSGFCHVHQHQVGTSPVYTDESVDTSRQCQAPTKAGRRCRNRTRRSSGHCHVHSSASPGSGSAVSKRPFSVSCGAPTKSGGRCKRKTKNASGRCYQHGG